jgi:erythromycin esterase
LRWPLLALLALLATMLGTLAAPVSAQSDSGFAAWGRRQIVPIAAGRPLRALDSLVDAARLVGVGESVHEVEQFVAFRAELLKDLVRRHRVTAVIVESGLPEALAVDDYVHGRTSSVDYATALGGDYGQLKAVRDVVEWLRAWNAGEGRRRPVSFYGADVSIGDGRSMLPALERLRAAAGGGDATLLALVDSITPLAARVSASWWNGALRNYAALPPDARERLTALAERLVDRAGRWSLGTADERACVERFAVLVRQDEVMLRRGPLSPESPRDVAMADNARWLVDRLPNGERAVVWAHNAHVQRVLITGPAVPAGAFYSMGARLARDLGDGYVAIGTAYGGPSADSASAPAPGSVDAALGEVGRGPFLLRLRGARPDGPAAAWLAGERLMRFQVGHLRVPLASAFDAVVYFDRADPAAKIR